MKIFLACLNTEANTFAPFPTGYRSFAETGYLIHHGQHEEEMLASPAPVFVCRRLAEAQGWEVIESLCAIAVPGGITARSVYEGFRQEILTDLQAALPVEAVFLDLHGAMVADGYDDCEGDLLAHIRGLVGPVVPIGATLDPHSHLTRTMIENATVLIMAKDYPHTDFTDRAQEVFSILAATSQGKIQPCISVYDCRMIIQTWPTTREPGQSFVAEMKRLERETERILSISVCHGMTWGDVPEMGAKVLVVTDNQPETGSALAAELGRRLFDLRGSTFMNLLSIEETLDRALEVLRREPGKPIVIADTTDNPGGGAPGDATFLLKALLEHGLDGAVFATLWDPIATATAIEAGEGAHLNLRIGGKMGPFSGNPIDVSARVVKVALDARQTFAGNPITIGNAAVIHVNGNDITLNSQRTQIFGVDCLTNLGIDPARKCIIVVKSSQHFYASFAPLAAAVLYCDAPGTLMMDIPRIPYRRIDRNKWPLVENPF